LTELKVYLSNTLSDRFRKVAMSVYGYGRGSLSKAAEDALSKWCEQQEQTGASPNGPSPKETRSDSREAKTIRIDPEERPETVAGAETSGSASVKSAG
jgi:hypothetical protein